MKRQRRGVDAIKIRSTAPLYGGSAHNPAFAEKAGIPQKVAKEFVAADKRAAKKKPVKKAAKTRTSSRKKTKTRA